MLEGVRRGERLAGAASSAHQARQRAGSCGAVFLTLFATLLWTIDCHEESYSTCSTEGRVQFWLAVAGLIPAVGGPIASIWQIAYPWRWIGATVLVYVTWALLVAVQAPG